MASTSAARVSANDVVSKIKRLVVRHGGENGVRGLSRALGITEDDGNAKIAKPDLVKAFHDYGVMLSDAELDGLFAHYDRNGDGTVVPTEIITALRCGLNPLRRSLIRRAWDAFPKDTDGNTSVQVLHARYRADRHPRVVRAEATAEEVQRQFHHSFDSETNPDGAITKQEFEQYYSGVSALVTTDEYFAAMMRGCWQLVGMDEGETTALALTKGEEGSGLLVSQSVEEKERKLTLVARRDAFVQLMQLHRQSLMAAPLGFRGVGRLLREGDKNATGFIGTAQFTTALWENRLYFDDATLFTFLDTNKNGSVDYILYLNYITGELPPCRHLMLERLWRTFSRDKENQTDILTLHKRYQAPNGEALGHFLNNWDCRRTPNGKVTFYDLIEFYVPISEATKMDAAFEKALKEAWGIA